MKKSASTSKKVTKGSAKKSVKKVSAKETKTKKVKAAETVEAKPEAVKKERKAKGPVVVITSAKYGTAEKSIEVASKMIVGRKITNKLAGEDPCPKVKKTLAVKATVDGNPVEKILS